MRELKKLSILFLCCLVVISTLASLGVTEARISGRKTIIKLMVTEEEAIWIKDWITEYEGLHSDIKIELSTGTMDTQKVFAQMVSKALPDIMSIESGPQQEFLMEYNVLERVPTDIIPLDYYVPPLRSMMTNFRGDLIGVPYSVSQGPYFCFDKAAIEMVGIDPQNFPEDYDSWQKIMMKFNESDEKGNLTRLAVNLNSDDFSTAIPWILGFVDPMGFDGSIRDYIGGYGNSPIKLNTPEIKNGLNRFKSLFTGETKIADSSPNLVYAFPAGSLSTETMAQFREPEKEWPVIEPPHVEGKPLKTMITTKAWAVTKTSKYKKRAWDFIKFMQEKNQFQEKLRMISLGSVWIPASEKWRKVDDILDEMVRRVTSDEMPVEKAVIWAEERVNQID